MADLHSWILAIGEPQGSGDPSPIGTASVLFIAVFLLLGAFFVGILLITIGRRRRGQNRRRAKQETPVDPWTEAGKRAQPLVDRSYDDVDETDRE